MFGLVEAVAPRYLTSASITDKIPLAVEYFKKGFKNYEIVGFLLIRHGILSSFRTVKRILRRFNLKRRNRIYTLLENTVDVIDREL